jgi:hypothetical protein
VWGWPGWWPYISLSPTPGAPGNKNDPFREGMDQGMHVLAGDGLRGRTARVAAASTFAGVAGPLVNVWGPSVPLPTGPASVVLHYRRLDTTNRASGAFGHGQTGGTASYLGCALPWSDGVVYWEYGGTTAGVTRLTVSGLTYGDDVWAFTTGSRGMEIWQNGIRRAANGANPTRTNANDYWGLFSHAIYASDHAESGCILLYNRQLELDEIQALTVDPWTPFRPSRRVRYGVAGAGGSGARVFVPAFIG